MSKKYPITLVSLPLVDEGELTNRDFCLRRLAVNKWCVCTYLRDYDRYTAEYYFKTKSEAQEYFNWRLVGYFEYYQELVNDQKQHIEMRDFLIEQISNCLTGQKRNKLIPLAIKVAKLDKTSNTYRLCSLMLTRALACNDPNEIIEIAHDLEESLDDNSISILI